MCLGTFSRLRRSLATSTLSAAVRILAERFLLYRKAISCKAKKEQGTYFYIPCSGGSNSLKVSFDLVPLRLYESHSDTSRKISHPHSSDFSFSLELPVCYGELSQMYEQSYTRSNLHHIWQALLLLHNGSIGRGFFVQNAIRFTTPVLSKPLRYLHSCKQTYSLFLPVHMLHPGSNKHKMHVEICLSSARTDIL